ncbi:MAG: arylesterase [Alphaproteobacteria bacterium]
MRKIKHFLLLFGILLWPAQNTYAVAQGAPTKILVLGDSLTAGYGLAPEEAFPAQLQRKLVRVGRQVQVLNRGVSGDTSAGGRARLNWVLGDKPDAVIIELGANDGLRGLGPNQLRDNLDAIISILKARKIAVLLTGMRAPPNFGAKYSAQFDAVYPSLAKKHSLPLYPFFLEGVVSEPGLNQKDGIHPNSRGVGKIVDQITPYVLRLIDGLANK